MMMVGAEESGGAKATSEGQVRIVDGRCRGSVRRNACRSINSMQLLSFKLCDICLFSYHESDVLNDPLKYLPFPISLGIVPESSILCQGFVDILCMRWFHFVGGCTRVWTVLAMSPDFICGVITREFLVVKKGNR
jgi:hypothetical protein